MKAKGGGAAMEAAEAERSWVCKNCKRPVATPNASLHEAHCLRFLTVCPRCQEPVARKELAEHLYREHRQVRCQLCHQAMEQYQLEHHQAEQCPERLVVCDFCELALPSHQLVAHVEACGSRTSRCWDCGKYVMFRALEGHRQGCPGRPPSEPKASPSQSWDPEERQQEPLVSTIGESAPLPGCGSPRGFVDESCPLPQLLGALSTHSPPGPGSPPLSPLAEKDVRPKRKDKDLPPVLGRPSLKPPRSKRSFSRAAFTPITPPPPEHEATGGPSAYDHLAACPQCDILLPGPTLEKHQKKCQRRAPALQAQRWQRRSPRFLGKAEESQAQSHPGKDSWQ